MHLRCEPLINRVIRLSMQIARPGKEKDMKGDNNDANKMKFLSNTVESLILL